MIDQAQVTACGEVVERPDMSETEGGIPTATFHVLVERRWTGRAGQDCDQAEFIEVRAVGHPANSIVKYWCPGVEVVVVGELRVRQVPDPFTQAAREMDPGCTFARAELYVEAQSIGFISPRACLEAAKIRGREW